MTWRVFCTSDQCTWMDGYRVGPTSEAVTRKPCPWCGSSVKAQPRYHYYSDADPYDDSAHYDNEGHHIHDA
jgi:hypothetical protein